MTRDEIIKLAQESGMELYGLGKNRERFLYHLERFAALLAFAERQRIAKKIEKLPFGDTSQSFAVWVRQDVP